MMRCGTQIPDWVFEDAGLTSIASLDDAFGGHDNGAPHDSRHGLHKGNDRKGAAQGGVQPRFKLVRFEDINLRHDRRHLVKNVIPREGLVVVWGPPKCGKTFWALDVAMHVATGRPYRERRTVAGTVVYVACEGERGIAARKEAWRKTNLTEHQGNVAFHLVTTRLDLVADAPTLIADIRAQVGDVTPVLVVIDTLNRSLNGSENKDEDMSAYVKAADAVREAFGAAVAVIHHCGAEGSRPRGHTSLTGAADAQIKVTKDANGTVTAVVEYMKDGEEGTAITSALTVVEVGIDEDGDVITSCTIAVADGATNASQNSHRGRPATQSDIALEALRAAIIDHGQTRTLGGKNGTKFGVPLDVWRTQFKATFLGDRDTPDKIRKAFQRASQNLQAAGKIGVWQDFIWLPGHPDKKGQK